MPRASFKVTDCDVNLIKRDMFETKKSYEYFLIGFHAARELQMLKDSGNIIMDSGTPLESNCDFYIAFDQWKDELSMPRLGTSEDGKSMTMWLGATMGNIPNTTFVYKRELKDAFGKITYVVPTNQKKFEVKELTDYNSMV
ncbi:hypothetical protein AB6W40_002609 [Salmonella enterica]